LFQPRAIISWPLLAFCLGGLFAIYDFQKHLYIITQKHRAMVGAHKKEIIHEQLSISMTTIS
jgi:hypothetical protein